MKWSIVVGVAALSLVGGKILAQPAASAAGGPIDIRQIMQQHTNPATLAIWDVGNNAMGDEGGIDPALMDQDKWDRLVASATQLAEAGRAMGAGSSFIAAAADNSTVGEGEITMAQVQTQLDGDPAKFRELGEALAAHSDRLAAAARAKDATAAGELIAAMDTVCEDCHARFWYPE